MPGQDQAALFSFLDYASEANLMNKGTAQSLKSACRMVLSVLDDREREDIFALDLNEVSRRFADAPHSPPINPRTVYAYQLRAENAIEDFKRYHADPVNWRPGRVRRQHRPRGVKPRNTQPASAIIRPPAAETIVHHFPIRKNHFVCISGIPFDITKSEMARMTNYLSHLVAVTDEQPAMPDSVPYVRPVPALPTPTVEPAVPAPAPVTEQTATPVDPAAEGNLVLDQPQEFGCETR